MSNELFVYEEFFCRGFGGVNKFKVPLDAIKQAINFALLTDETREEREEEIEDFMSVFDNKVIHLLEYIINVHNFVPDFDVNSILTDLDELGRFNIESEEQGYGIGRTKELAYIAFGEINGGSFEENWD